MNNIRLSNKLSIELFQRITLFFVLILPLKFGAPAALPEINIFPDSVIMWIFSFWPPVLFSVISALLMSYSQFIPSSPAFNSHNNARAIPFLLFALAFASLSGFLRAACLDFPVLECLYIFGLAAFSAAVFRFLLLEENNSLLILRIIAVSTLIIVIYGLYQYFLGFEDTRKYVAEELSQKGFSLAEEAKIRFNSNFIFSTFSISNNFAAHLILAAPISCYVVLRSECFGIKILRYFAAFLTVSAFALALLLSGSRGAVLSFALALLFLFALLSTKSRKAAIFLLAMLFIPAAIIFLIPKDSGSVFIRFDYLHTGIILLKNNFFAGAGWGEFFHSYTYLKKFMATETPHDPHNFIISMGSQAGIAALIAAILFMLVPIFLASKKLTQLPMREKFKTMDFFLLLGFTAWCVHSLMDTNFQIPGTAATAVILSMIMLKSNAATKCLCCSGTISKLFKAVCAIIAVIIALAGSYRLCGEYFMNKLDSVCSPQIFKDTNASVSFDEAERLLAKAVDVSPYSPFPWITFGDYAYRNGLKVEAEQCYLNAVRLSPRRANLYYELANIQMENGKPGYALKSMKIASELFPFKYEESYSRIREMYCNKL